MKKQAAIAAILDLADAMDGNELDALISALAEVRKDKLPGVAQKRPSPTDPLTMETPVTMEDDPGMLGVRLRDGRVRLWMRSSGFGWLAFNLPIENARTLRDWFAANVDGDSDLFGDQVGQFGPAH